MKNWLEHMGTEVMDSIQQKHLINYALLTVNRKIGDFGHTLCVGVGDGTEMGFIPDCEGIDINDTSLRICQEKGFSVQKMDMHKMTFKDNTFDLVFSKDSFEHAISPIEVMEQFARVSKKYVVIVVPNEEWQSDGFHLIIPTLKQMLSLAEKAGLVLVAYREYNLLVNARSVFQALYIFQKL